MAVAVAVRCRCTFAPWPIERIHSLETNGHARTTHRPLAATSANHHCIGSTSLGRPCFDNRIRPMPTHPPIGYVRMSNWRTSECVHPMNCISLFSASQSVVCQANESVQSIAIQHSDRFGRVSIAGKIADAPWMGRRRPPIWLWLLDTTRSTRDPFDWDNRNRLWPMFLVRWRQSGDGKKIDLYD